MGHLDFQSLLEFKVRSNAGLFLLALLFFQSAAIAEPAKVHSPETGRSIHQLRLVSLAPSITEVIFAIGAESTLRGVTRYCDYPPEAQALPKIGGFLDPNIESILGRQPHLVLALPQQVDSLRNLERFGVKIHALKQDSISDILSSISNLGALLNAGDAAHTLKEKINAKIHRIQARVRDKPRPRVLVSVGGHARPGELSSVYVAGSDTFYAELIELAGGRNAYQGVVANYAAISAEGVIRLDPEVIIDLSPSSKDSKSLSRAAQRTWQSLPNLSAVKNKRVTVLTQDYTVTPGPRIVNTLELFAKAIHPSEFPHEASP